MKNKQNKTEFYAIAFLITGLIYLAMLLLRGKFEPPIFNQQLFAEFVSRDSSFYAAIGYVVGMVFHTFAFIFLFLKTRFHEPGLSGWGLFLSVTGLILTCVFMGQFIYIYPDLGRLYLNGNHSVMQVAVDSGGSFFIASIMLESILVSAGSVIFSLVLKKYEIGQAWSRFMFAAAPFLFTTPLYGYVFEILGAFLLAASSVGILISLRK